MEKWRISISVKQECYNFTGTSRKRVIFFREACKNMSQNSEKNRKHDFHDIRKEKNALLFCLFLITVIFGYIGTGISNRTNPTEAMSFSERTYRILQMFVLNYGPHAYNVFTNTARFTGAVFSAGVILSFAWKYLVHLSEHLRVCLRDSVIVYGKGEETDLLIHQLGLHGIQITPDSGRFLKGKRYILMSSEEDNFRFLENNPFPRDAMIWLKTETLPGILPAGRHLFMFSFDELAAQRYWKEYPLYEDAFTMDGQPLKEVHVSVISLGRQGNELLYAGVQMNAFDPDQKIIYHVLANGKETETYAGAHDPDNLAALHIILEETGWNTEKGKKILSSSNRVILLETVHQAEIINDLLSMYPRINLDVFTATRIPQEAFLPNRNGRFSGRLRFFAKPKETDTVAEITGAAVLAEAKERNYRYVCAYGEKYKDADEAWDALDDNFKRYSNIRTVLFDHMMAECIHRYWQDMDEEKLKQKLIRLEHRSWMNYYLISNWHYGPVRNDAMRIHPDLVPFEELTQEEKDKDLPSAQAMIALSRELQRGEK